MIPIRPNVLGMEPYVQGKPIEEVKRELGLTRVVKLASNENPFGPSPKAVAAIQEAASTMHLYPDGGAYALKQAISSKFDIATNQIMVGNGSDELIHLLGLITLDKPTDELMMCNPGFARYDASAHLAPCRLVKIPVDSKHVQDLEAMADAVNENTRIIYLANPNNPTGTIVRRNAVDRFLDRVPESVVVVLDEAYYEFAMHHPEFPTSLEYIKAGRENVVGLRTMSKAQGLAGLRIGYGFASTTIVDAINRAREPFNVSRLAQVAAIAALEDDEHVRKTVEHNRRGLELLAGVFAEVGAEPGESFANFMYADFHRPTRPIYQALLQRGVITRPGDLLGNPNCLRVSIGTQEEMDIFVEELRNVTTPAVAK
ncbi:histidinol-phosphate transaminase [Fimbriimonas ginsengisoli]|uniref:Histidinol-phosphate aminotransferase n=1 Tax=Fimbriimonas ginsengisoli Gsoil 348 TaxID=661478 RepID=A0A068NIR0_FIMGI|nr:histidinol-phosphate transaminase [Fimbriimonas ginsengisoli]AIE83483.1 histidinol-phosphate aminotransferase [Fimbriimonas ginsengisoli Gsoil 348]